MKKSKQEKKMKTKCNWFHTNYNKHFYQKMSNDCMMSKLIWRDHIISINWLNKTAIVRYIWIGYNFMEYLNKFMYTFFFPHFWNLLLTENVWVHRPPILYNQATECSLNSTCLLRNTNSAKRTMVYIYTQCLYFIFDWIL